MKFKNAVVNESSQFNKVISKCLLTNREIEYLSLAALGYKNTLIAEILTVTRSTAKKTFETIFRKLQARDRTHAVTIAFIHKILSVEVLNEIQEKYNLKPYNKI